MRIPVDVVDELKELAPKRGFTAYQTLLKFYISEGLRRDEARNDVLDAQARLAAALKRRGVSDALVDDAIREASGER
jgi:hypothetical protein